MVLIRDKAHGRMDNFKPSQYDTELGGKAFKDNLGEFTISSLAVESMVSKDDLVCEVLAAACSRKEVKRIMVVPTTARCMTQCGIPCAARTTTSA